MCIHRIVSYVLWQFSFKRKVMNAVQRFWLVWQPPLLPRQTNWTTLYEWIYLRALWANLFIGQHWNEHCYMCSESVLVSCAENGSENLPFCSSQIIGVKIRTLKHVLNISIKNRMQRWTMHFLCISDSLTVYAPYSTMQQRAVLYCAVLFVTVLCCTLIRLTPPFTLHCWAC